MKTMLKLLGTAALAFGFSMAQAAQLDCPANIADNVSGATDCEYSSTATQDNTTIPLIVNTEAFFGFTDWTYAKKDELASNAGQSGTYNFGAVYDTMMLVFKDGAGTTLVGYIVSTSSGTWTTPFENPPFVTSGTPKDTSHISYYYRSGSTVPEPATLMLLGLGLAGLAVVRRRRAS